LIHAYVDDTGIAANAPLKEDGQFGRKAIAVIFAGKDGVDRTTQRVQAELSDKLAMDGGRGGVRGNFAWAGPTRREAAEQGVRDDKPAGLRETSRQPVLPAVGWATCGLGMGVADQQHLVALGESALDD
jgi:hypothetical protein